MENITIGQIALALTFILSIISNIKGLIKEFNNPIDKKLEKALKPVKDEISSLKTDFNNHIIDTECISKMIGSGTTSDPYRLPSEAL